MDIIKQLENLQDLGEAITHVENVVNKHNDECTSEEPEQCEFHTRCLTAAIVMSRLGLSLEDIGFVGAQLVCVESLADMAFGDEEDNEEPENIDALDANEIG